MRKKRQPNQGEITKLNKELTESEVSWMIAFHPCNGIRSFCPDIEKTLATEEGDLLTHLLAIRDEIRANKLIEDELVRE